MMLPLGMLGLVYAIHNNPSAWSFPLFMMGIFITGAGLIKWICRIVDWTDDPRPWMKTLWRWL